jgi:hypothetical protein
MVAPSARGSHSCYKLNVNKPSETILLSVIPATAVAAAAANTKTKTKKLSSPQK